MNGWHAYIDGMSAGVFAPALALALAAGFCTGLAFYYAIYWQARGLLASRRHAVTIVALAAGRFILLSVVLALSSRAGALGILVALAGVLLARGTALAWLNRGLA
ncbi:N-ATPase, AtpR subunit [mine drainage metagenome]|uniref:Uncharacterized protein n=2 Tax=root TaxID=1 RepID=A0A238D7Y4_THIDL|nr:ATP synthase subunit I [Thiomonas delicata]SBP89365.1 conserved membrane hypothetical protein [Thiomonas delicata]